MGFVEVKEKADAIQKAVEESSILVGQSGTGSIPGLKVPVGLEGMGTYSKSLQVLSNSLKTSMFKMLFMGTFKNGKSTTINALLGQRLLPVGVTATTAVISQVVYGEDDGRVRIFKNGSPVPEEISFEQFKEKYKLTREDKQLIDKQGSVDRFEFVDYVLLKNDSDLIKNGVQLIDSPGLEEAKSRTKATQQFFPQANAIIFLLDASKLFSEKEKSFIGSHFALVEPKPRNVFFLVNRINQVEDEEDGLEEIKREVSDILKPVFTSNGVFNPDLFDKRVFLVNSLGAYKEKQSGNASDELGVKEFKRFEKELETFLTSNDRVLARYQPVAANLAAVCLEAKKHIEERRQIMAKPIAELERNHRESEKKLAALEKDITGMEKTIDNTRALVAEKIMADLQKFLTTDILATWKKHSETFDKKLGILDMLKLALPIYTDKEKQEIFRPMISFVQEFVEQQLIEWSENSEVLIQNDLENMRSDLDSQSEEFSINLSVARGIFVNGSEVPVWEGGEGANKLQLALSIIQGDFSVAVENASGGNFTWGQFIKKYIFQAVINIIIVILVGGGPLGLAALLTVEAMQIQVGANARSVTVLNNLASKVFPKVAESMNKKRDDILANINEQFAQIKNNVTQAARDLIEDERQTQAKIIADKEKTEAENRRELNRQEVISNELRKRAALVYNALYNREPTDENLRALAASVAVGKRESA